MDIITLINEARQVGSAFLVTGAFNPYTRGHEEVAKAAAEHASRGGYSHFYHGLGASENASDAPLSFRQKEGIVKGSHSYIQKSIPKTKMKFGIVPQKASVSPFHQIVHLIERGGHKNITIGIGPDQDIGGGTNPLRAQIEKHIATHGGMLGSDKKTVHKVKIDFYRLAAKRDESKLSADDLRKLIIDNRLPVEHAKGGRIRQFVMSGDLDIAHAMMPESIHATKGGPQAYSDMIKKQFTDVVPAAEESRRIERNKKAAILRKKKKKITEEFSIDKLEQFQNVLDEAQIVQSVIRQRKTALQNKINRAKSASRTHRENPLQRKARILKARQQVKIEYARRIIGAKHQEIKRGMNRTRTKVGAPRKTIRESYMENILQSLNEATKRRGGVKSPASVRAKTRTEVRSAGQSHKKEKIRKQEERKAKKRTPNYAVVLGGDKKIRIVRKEDIGKSKVIVTPDKFDKSKARKYLDDSQFEITDSSKKLFPEFRRGGKPKQKPAKKKKKKTSKKPQQQTVTSKPPREVLQKTHPLAETPPKGVEVTSGKSQYPDWNHDAVKLEEAIPAVLNQMMKVKTGEEGSGIFEALETSKTLFPSAQRAVELVMQQIGPCVAIHMGKNKGVPSKEWLAAGGRDATAKSDIVFVPEDVWKKTKGNSYEEKVKNVDPKKCIRASMKCGDSRLLNGESGEAIATVNAGNAFAGDIASKNPRVAKLIKKVRDAIKEFAKSAELGIWSTKEIRKMINTDTAPRNAQFQKARALIEAQDALKDSVNSMLNEIYDESEEFKIGVVLESLTGMTKFGADTIQCANYVLACNLDGTGVKLEAISEELVRRMIPDLQFRGAFKGRSKKAPKKGQPKIRTLSTLYNIDYKPGGGSSEEEEDLQEGMGEDYYQQDPQLFRPQDIEPQEAIGMQQDMFNFAGTAAIVDNDLRQIGNNVSALTEYCDLEPAMISSNELDVSDYMQGPARTYNIITIDGSKQVAIPVQDFQSFENNQKQLGEESYEFINDFLVENIDNQEALDLALSSGLVSPDTIQSVYTLVELDFEKSALANIMCEMWENSLIKPDLFNVFMNEARNYRKEYDNYHSRPEQRKNRSNRVLARRKMIKKGRVKKGDGKDVDHKDGNPQNNGDSNLRVLSKSKNRSMNEEHGAGEIGTKKLLNKYIEDTPYAINPIIKKVVKNGVRSK